MALNTEYALALYRVAELHAGRYPDHAVRLPEEAPADLTSGLSSDLRAGLRAEGLTGALPPIPGTHERRVLVRLAALRRSRRRSVRRSARRFLRRSAGAGGSSGTGSGSGADGGCGLSRERAATPETGPTPTT